LQNQELALGPAQLQLLSHQLIFHHLQTAQLMPVAAAGFVAHPEFVKLTSDMHSIWFGCKPD